MMAGAAAQVHLHGVVGVVVQTLVVVLILAEVVRALIQEVAVVVEVQIFKGEQE